MPYLRNAWYCCAYSNEVDRKPLGRILLDQPVVVFRKTDGGVAALSDVCPHRFAPLHQGKLENEILSCPYHGLGFDSAGACVHNPNGDGRIPPRSSIRTYPVVERQGVVWIWMGDCDVADWSSIVDLELLGGDDGPRVSGYIRMDADYRLIIDNLLDLNHAPYLHPGTLSPEGATREARFERGVQTAASHYLMRSVPTPASQRLWFEDPVGDYHVSMECIAPSVLRQSIAMTGEGNAREGGAMMKGVHLLTPESATSTHYFWAASRNRRVEDKDLDQKFRTFVEQAFLNEDGPMIKACQRNMAGREFSDLKPLFLDTDVAAGHARVTLEKMIAAESERQNT